MDYKQMCVQQGYVPPTCELDGQMVWLLMQEGKDPCKGCNVNRKRCQGRHAPYDNSTYRMFCAFDLQDDLDRKQREQRRLEHEREIEKRKESHIKGYDKSILEIRQEMGRRGGIDTEIVVKDVRDEKAYCLRCESKAFDEIAYIVRRCCCKYNIKQIHVELNGYGMGMYDVLVNSIPEIDIVPLRYSRLKLEY